jgi:NTP pyrophosphatase (non-canonical NTP hydrolase)
MSGKTLNDYKLEVINLCGQKGWLGPSIEHVWMYFTEEVGELAGSIRRHNHQFKDRKRYKLESELGDVFSYLFQLAYMLNVNLDTMWEQQKLKIAKKRYYNVNGSVFSQGGQRRSMQESWKIHPQSTGVLSLACPER